MSDNQTGDGWVKCSERLPEEDGFNWWLEQDDREPKRFFFCRNALDVDGKWSLDSFTHWHPDTRPAPPESEE